MLIKHNCSTTKSHFYPHYSQYNSINKFNKKINIYLQKGENLWILKLKDLNY